MDATAAAATAQDRNAQILATLHEKLKVDNVESFSAACHKLARWLQDGRAYYKAARPKIVELLETASATARRNTAREVAKRSTQISRWWLAYQSLVQVIQGHAKLFVESELQKRLVDVLGQVPSASELSPSSGEAQSVVTAQVQPSGAASAQPQRAAQGTAASQKAATASPAQASTIQTHTTATSSTVSREPHGAVPPESAITVPQHVASKAPTAAASPTVSEQPPTAHLSATAGPSSASAIRSAPSAESNALSSSLAIRDKQRAKIQGWNLPQGPGNSLASLPNSQTRGAAHSATPVTVQGLAMANPYATMPYVQSPPTASAQPHPAPAVTVQGLAMATHPAPRHYVQSQPTTPAQPIPTSGPSFHSVYPSPYLYQAGPLDPNSYRQANPYGWTYGQPVYGMPIIQRAPGQLVPAASIETSQSIQTSGSMRGQGSPPAPALAPAQPLPQAVPQVYASTAQPEAPPPAPAAGPSRSSHAKPHGQAKSAKRAMSMAELAQLDMEYYNKKLKHTTGTATSTTAKASGTEAEALASASATVASTSKNAATSSPASTLPSVDDRQVGPATARLLSPRKSARMGTKLKLPPGVRSSPASSGMSLEETLTSTSTDIAAALNMASTSVASVIGDTVASLSAAVPTTANDTGTTSTAIVQPQNDWVSAPLDGMIDYTGGFVEEPQSAETQPTAQATEVVADLTATAEDPLKAVDKETGISSLPETNNDAAMSDAAVSGIPTAPPHEEAQVEGSDAADNKNAPAAFPEADGDAAMGDVTVYRDENVVAEPETVPVAPPRTAAGATLGDVAVSTEGSIAPEQATAPNATADADTTMGDVAVPSGTTVITQPEVPVSERNDHDDRAAPFMDTAVSNERKASAAPAAQIQAPSDTALSESAQPTKAEEPAPSTPATAEPSRSVDVQPQSLPSESAIEPSPEPAHSGSIWSAFVWPALPLSNFQEPSENEIPAAGIDAAVVASTEASLLELEPVVQVDGSGSVTPTLSKDSIAESFMQPNDETVPADTDAATYTAPGAESQGVKGAVDEDMGTVQENVKPHDDGSDAAEVLEDVKGDKGAQVPTQQKPAYTDVEPSIPSAEESRSAVTEDIEMSEEDTSGPSQTPAEEGTAAAYIDVEPNSTEPIQAVSQGPPTEDVEMAETEVVETNPAEAELLGEARADSDPEVTPVHEDSSREITDVLMVAPVLESQPTASPVADVHREDAISAPGAEPITLDILPHSIPSGNDREGYPYLAIYGGASSELGVTKTATVDKVEPSAAQIVDAALDAEEALKQAPDAPSDAAERADASAGSVTEPNPSPESHFVMLYSMKCLPGPRQHQHVLEFHLNVEQHGIVRQWSNRRSIPGNSFESGLCISLVCYRSTNLPLVDQDATARPRAEWPNTGTMWAVINESEGRELYLVPAFHIDKDGLVDISSYIKEGDNRMQVFYSGCSSDYTVVLQAHSPTPTQAQLERDRRRKDLERATYLTKLAEPIKLPNFNWDTGMFETA